MQTANQIIHLLPENVASVCPIFNVKDCKFACEKEKESTARIVLFKELGILNSYTLETTFFGSEFFKKPLKKQNTMGSNMSTQNTNSTTSTWINSDPREDIHITIFDLIEVGKDFCRGINAGCQAKLIQKYWFKVPEIKKFKEKRFSLTKLNSDKLSVADKYNIQG